MDILRELSDDELDFIKCKLKKHLPYAIKDLYFIESAEKCKHAMKSCDEKLSDKVVPKFYTHRNGKKENCTIFGITGECDHTVWYFSFDETLREITECLEETKLIKWGTRFLFVTLHTEQIQPVLEYAAKNRHAIESNEENSYFYLPSEIALNFKIETQPETMIVPLEKSDAEMCNSLWKWKNSKSEIWMKSLILINGGYALKDSSSREFLSFAIVNDHMAIGALTTINQAQRKGYGEIIVKYMAKKMAEEGLVPTAYISNENPKGFNLFTKLGYKKIGMSNWIVIKETSVTNN